MTIIAKNKLRPKVKKIWEQIPIKKDSSYEEIHKDINKTLPINFKKYNFVNKVHDQHPSIPKEEIAIIIKTMFEVIREQVIEGYALNVKYLLNEFRLSLVGEGKLKKLKIKNRTFPSVRKMDYGDK